MNIDELNEKLDVDEIRIMSEFYKMESARRVSRSKEILSLDAITEPNDFRKALFSALVALDPRTPFITTGFAVELHDFEKHIRVSSGGGIPDKATYGDFHSLNLVCEKAGTHVAIVIDAEGEIVCLAPIAVAMLIARLLDKSEEFADDAIINHT
jgi:hypothetical protein